MLTQWQLCSLLDGLVPNSVGETGGCGTITGEMVRVVTEFQPQRSELSQLGLRAPDLWTSWCSPT